MYTSNKIIEKKLSIKNSANYIHKHFKYKCNLYF